MIVLLQPYLSYPLPCIALHFPSSRTKSWHLEDLDLQASTIATICALKVLRIVENELLMNHMIQQFFLWWCSFSHWCVAVTLQSYWVYGFSPVLDVAVNGVLSMTTAHFLTTEMVVRSTTDLSPVQDMPDWQMCYSTQCMSWWCHSLVWVRSARRPLCRWSRNCGHR